MHGSGAAATLRVTAVFFLLWFGGVAVLLFPFAVIGGLHRELPHRDRASAVFWIGEALHPWLLGGELPLTLPSTCGGHGG